MLAGCAATGPAFQPASAPDSGRALIYIYRPGGFTLGGRDAYFYVNDKNVADLSAEGYTYFYLSPGTYKLTQKWPLDLIGFRNLELPLVVTPGQTYYYKFTASGEPICGYNRICYAWSMRKMEENTAKNEILIYRYQTAK